MKYKAREGANFGDETAQILGERIEKLMSKDGKITPSMIVKDAENPRSPFHRFMEWDNHKASELYRLEQARGIIKKIVQVTMIEGERRPHRSFFSVYDRDTKTKSYVTLKNVAYQKDYRNQVIQRSITELENLMSLLKLLKSNLK